MADYDKVGLLTIREGRILLCRKKHTTSLLILPGGCKEPGETSVECLLRELHEELGDVQVEALEYLGTYSDRAAGDESKTVQIELYASNLKGDPHPQSEIRELVWFSPEGSWDPVAPSIRNQIFPDLQRRGIIQY